MQQVCAALGVPLEMLEVPPMAASVLQRMCVNLLKVTPATTLTPDGVSENCFRQMAHSSRAGLFWVEVLRGKL
jgi:hypothetical protein